MTDLPSEHAVFGVEDRVGATRKGTHVSGQCIKFIKCSAGDGHEMSSTEPASLSQSSVTSRPSLGGPNIFGYSSTCQRLDSHDLIRSLVMLTAIVVPRASECADALHFDRATE